MCVVCCVLCLFFFQAEDGIRDLVRSRGLGDVYKRQALVQLNAIVEQQALLLACQSLYQWLAAVAAVAAVVVMAQRHLR